jgi:uncharacterized protein YidB (DUF937 family)
MASLDDALKNAVPGGNLATPLAIAAGALLLGHFFGGKGAAPAAPTTPAAPAAPSAPMGGGLLGGLSDLVSKLQGAGAGSAVNSWIGGGANQPIQPGQLGSALGQTTITSLAQKAGMSESDLLAQLSQALPGIINHLTPNGRLPLAGEVGDH